MQKCSALLQSLKKSTDGFFQGRSYAAVEGPAAGGLPKGNGGVGPPEPRKGGGALALSAELAKELDGGAVKSTVQKPLEICKFYSNFYLQKLCFYDTF